MDQIQEEYEQLKNRMKVLRIELKKEYNRNYIKRESQQHYCEVCEKNIYKGGWDTHIKSNKHLANTIKNQNN